MKEKFKVLKNKVENKYIALVAFIFSFIPAEVFAEDRNVNTKYFGNDQKFWTEIQSWYGWFMGFLWFVTILMLWIALTKAGGKAAQAKMAGNSTEFYRSTKNYSQLVLNLALAIGFLTLLATIMGAYIFLQAPKK